jgi:hypothetical protein
VISGVEIRGAVSLSGSPLVVFGSGLFLCPGLLFFILLARLYRLSGWRIGWGAWLLKSRRRASAAQGDSIRDRDLCARGIGGAGPTAR